MAKRNTYQEALTVKAQFEKNHPDAKIIIDCLSGESQMYPGAIKVQGLEDQIIGYANNGYPIIKWEEFEILELVKCPTCGQEWKNAAVGESGSLCSSCREQAAKQRDLRSNAQIRADTADTLFRSQSTEDWYE